MVIKKQTLLMVIIFLFVLFGLSVFLFLPKKSSLYCSTFKDRYPLSDCGYVSSTVDQKSADVMGIVRKKYQRNHTFNFDIETKDAKGEKVTAAVAFPPDTLKAAVTMLTPSNQLGSSQRRDETTLYSPAETWHKLSLNQIIIVRLINPDSLDIKRYREKLGNQPFITCLGYNKQLIQYIKNPTLVNRLLMLLGRLRNTCEVTTFQIILHG